MTRRIAFATAGTLVLVSTVAACAPPPGDGKAAATPDTGVTVFGDARLGVAYGPDTPGGKSRTRIVAE